jgi:hypothetical protein
VTIFAYVGAAVVEAIAGGILTGAIAERRRWKAIDNLRNHHTTPSPDAMIEVATC